MADANFCEVCFFCKKTDHERRTKLKRKDLKKKTASKE